MTVDFGARIGLRYDSLKDDEEILLDGVEMARVAGGAEIEHMNNDSLTVSSADLPAMFVSKNGTMTMLNPGNWSSVERDGQNRIRITEVDDLGSYRDIVYDSQGNASVRVHGREVAVAPPGSLIREYDNCELKIFSKNAQGWVDVITVGLDGSVGRACEAVQRDIPSKYKFEGAASSTPPAPAPTPPAPAPTPPAPAPTPPAPAPTPPPPAAAPPATSTPASPSAPVPAPTGKSEAAPVDSGGTAPVEKMAAATPKLPHEGLPVLWTIKGKDGTVTVFDTSSVEMPRLLTRAEKLRALQEQQQEQERAAAAARAEAGGPPTIDEIWAIARAAAAEQAARPREFSRDELATITRAVFDRLDEISDRPATGRAGFDGRMSPQYISTYDQYLRGW